MMHHLVQFKDMISCEENIMAAGVSPDFMDGSVIAGTNIDMTAATANGSDCICITVLTMICY